MRGMPLARAARHRLDIDSTADVATEGFGPDLAATRRLADRIAASADVRGLPAQAGELAAIGLLHEILHLLATRLAVRDPGRAPSTVARRAIADVGAAEARSVRNRFDREFPGAAAGEPIEELLLVRVANENPAATPYRWLFDDSAVVGSPDGTRLLRAIEEAAGGGIAVQRGGRTAVGPAGQTLLELLRAPAAAAPTSLAGQLRYVRDHWRGLLGPELDALLDRATLVLDVIAEEERGLHLRFGGGPGPGGEAPGLGEPTDEERFSADLDWMPRLVLIAKSTYVWLDQLSRRYAQDIRTLDAVPDAELDELARWGVTGLWLIGLWQRSRASERIKRWRGNEDAVASAYSLDEYRIADDLGGEAAWVDLRDRAWRRGIRLASDMVPNHMGIDSRWVIEHPERFLSLDAPPYPAYSYQGEDLSDDPRVEIRIEDHYWDGTDAAVVFERTDPATGEVRYVYHGNDGTSTPWNDTAQLDYSRAEVREAVIGTILEVARRFPIIRFDAAMTLARRHIQRLWFPPPGAGGAIPSRAEHGMTREAFAAAMPHEFWRDVVDRVAAEAPDTLLLAEAFWLMEGYFVRTLGMHRVYNSAFMHMLRDEDGAGYRKVLRDTLEFDPEILKRYVNFMSNPDEKTAVEQFGKGDKYVGVATVLATIPGLPMLGHGQVEGYTEKYGMEYRRARLEETADAWLVERHERDIFPLLHRRARFAEVRDFLLYDLVRDDGAVDDHVLAYSNGSGPSRSLVVYHNRYAETAGWIRESVPYSVATPGGERHLTRRTLAEGWALDDEPGLLIRARDHATGLEHLWFASELRDRGLRLDLRAYERRVLLDVAEVRESPAGHWTRLAERLGGRGVPSLERAVRDLELEPVHGVVAGLAGHPAVLDLVRSGRAPSAGVLGDAIAAAAQAIGDAGGKSLVPDEHIRWTEARIAALAALVGDRPTDRTKAGRRSAPDDPLDAVRSAFGDAWHRAVLAEWALFAPVGTSFERLDLAQPVAVALRDAGLDDVRARSAATRVGVLVALDDRDRDERVGPAAGPRVAFARDWFSDAVTRSFLGVNEWDGVEWLGREPWRELLDWTLLLDAIDARADDGLDDAGRAAALAASRSAVDRLLEAGEVSRYRVDRLLEGTGPPTR
jgi:glycosidase